MSNLLTPNTINVLSAPTVRASLILKHGSAADWAAVNPVLNKGEMGIELDTGLLKIGDGTSNYNILSYINVTPAQLNTVVETKIEGILSSYLQKPEMSIQGNLPIFDENGNLIDSGVSIDEYSYGSIASDTVPGVVLSSDDDNSVSVDDTGKMSLNRVSTSNLYIPDEEELILSAGDSNQ